MAPVAAVVPTFNAPAARLAAAVASLGALPCVGRIVVVDDGSSPPASVCGERARLLRAPNAGPSAARNRGLEALLPLQEEWVVFLDDDDEALPGLAAEVDLAAGIGGAGAVGARIAVRGEREEAKPVPPEWADRALPRGGDVFRPILLFSASGMLVHRRVVEAGVRFDEGLRIGEDRDFLRRVAREGAIAVCSRAVVRQAVHAGGDRLTSPAQISRRIRDHLTLLGRHCDAESEPHFQEATRWLLSAAARAGVERGEWALLAAEARRRGWPVPLKALARIGLRGR